MDCFFFFPFNEHACQNSSQEIPVSIGIAAVGGLRLVHPSLWGNRCYHWFTLQACESKSTSVTTYGKELSAAAEQKSTERKVNQDTRQDTAPTLKTDKWNLFYSSCGKPTWAEERKRKESDRQQFTECAVHNPQCLFSGALHPSSYIKNSWKVSARYCTSEEPSPHPLPEPRNHSQGLAETLLLAICGHKKTQGVPKVLI